MDGNALRQKLAVTYGIEESLLTSSARLRDVLPFLGQDAPPNAAGLFPDLKPEALDAAELVMFLEEAFSLELSPRDAARVRRLLRQGTVQDLAAFLDSRA